MHTRAAMRDPGMLICLLGASPAGRNDHIMWIMMDWMTSARGLISLTRGVLQARMILRSMHAATVLESWTDTFTMAAMKDRMTQWYP